MKEHAFDYIHVSLYAGGHMSGLFA